MGASSTLAYVGVAAALAGTSYSVVSSENAKSDAKAAADKQAKDQEDLLNAAKDKDTQDKALADAQNEQNAELVKVKNLQAGQGRAGTILTSPLGETSTGGSAPAATSGKTLLGT